jgi:hypothetical protein
MSDVRAIVESSDLRSFLGAEVVTGASGERLTIGFALSHLGYDRNLEAQRLARLSRKSTASQWAETIVATPRSLWEFSNAAIISERLAHLLPVP